MVASTTRVDDEGIVLGAEVSGAVHVSFDDQRVWSTKVQAQPGKVVTWPKRLQRRLDGRSVVRVETDDATLFEEEVSFGSGEGRLRFVGDDGTPIIIDKWGFVQRPLEARREAGVVSQMVGVTQQILQIMRDDCGIQGWISFGTLLGAARNGQAIGHDSDVDLCFLSDHESPAATTADLWRIARALRRNGLKVQHRAGSFVTVHFQASDGNAASIDIYCTFFVGDLFYATATIRTPLDRSAILPLSTIEFEGVPMPAPADPARLLAISYGPNWKVPDPSFQHTPGRQINERFDDWFGTLVRGRRDWATWNRDELARHQPPTPFARWVGGQLPTGHAVVEVGSGSGRDLIHYATLAERVIGFDHAGVGRKALRNQGAPDSLELKAVNLKDLRDALTAAAMVTTLGEPVVLVARRLLEALDAPTREHFWAMTRQLLRARGGRLYLESVTRAPKRAARWQEEHQSGPLFPLPPVGVLDAIERAGGRVVASERVAEASAALRSGGAVSWRVVADWPGSTTRTVDSLMEELP